MVYLEGDVGGVEQAGGFVELPLDPAEGLMLVFGVAAMSCAAI
jgi:hypothetical protein